MCLHPNLIPNPYYGVKVVPGKPSCLHDCTNQYIYVPCGHCPQCIAVKQMYTVQRVLMETLENHLFFATLTYNEESLPRVAVSSGYSIPFADVRDLQCMFKRIEKDKLFSRPFKRFAVSERGSTYGRPHFHVLFSVPRYPDDNWMSTQALQDELFSVVLSQWRRNVAPYVWSPKSNKWRPNTRSPKYQPLLTYLRFHTPQGVRSTYDLHYVVPSAYDSGISSVAFYVLKYMLKPSTKERRLQQALRLNLPEDEYDEVWPLVRSQCYVSHGFGINPSAVKHIKSGIAYSLRQGYDYPLFINNESGQTFPLAPFYKDRFLTYNDAIGFYMNSSSKSVDSSRDFERFDPSTIQKMYSDYEKNLLHATSVDVLDDVSLLDVLD